MKLRTAIRSLRKNVVSMKLLVLMTVSDDCGLPSDSIRQSDPDHGRLGPRSMTRSKILRPCCFGHTPGGHLSPFMVLVSPTKRCGKTTVLILLYYLTPRAEWRATFRRVPSFATSKRPGRRC